MGWLDGKSGGRRRRLGPLAGGGPYGGRVASRFGVGLVLLHVLEQYGTGYWRFIDEHFRKEVETRAEE